MDAMTTVILGENAEVQTMIEQRRALGQDGSDEIWEGVYYMTPHAGVDHALLQMELGGVLRELAPARGLNVSGEFNLGKPNDFRVPDLGVHRSPSGGLYALTAAMVVEILSPNDQTFKKFDFYGRHGVEEILVADLDERSIRIWTYDSATSSYRASDRSTLLATSARELQATVSWP
jgi:Uma2 family endonuclease